MFSVRHSTACLISHQSSRRSSSTVGSSGGSGKACPPTSSSSGTKEEVGAGARRTSSGVGGSAVGVAPEKSRARRAFMSKADRLAVGNASQKSDEEKALGVAAGVGATGRVPNVSIHGPSP